MPALPLLAIAATAAALGAPAATSPPQKPLPPQATWYTLVDLGPLGGSGEVVAVNDAGVAAGFVVANGTTVARTWPARPLPAGGYLASAALAINALGTVVGFASGCPNGCPNGTLTDEAVVWRDGRLQVATPLLGASGVNDSGLVVGADSLNGLGTRAVAWRNGSLLTFAPLAQLTNPFVATANAVNNAGLVVGVSLTGPGVEHAFAAQVLARGVPRTVDLGTLPPPFNESNAFAVNQRGDIAGASSAGFGADSHAVLWADRKLTDLGALAPASWGGTAALGIDDADEVVGYAGGHDQVDRWVPGSPPDTHAVLWHDGVALDLNRMVGGGWDLEVAHDVNDEGEIVGNGLKPGDTVPHGFMLVPQTKLASLTVSPSSLPGGKGARATLTLNRPAPPGDATVYVASSPAGSVGVPQTVTVPSGRASVTFPISSTPGKRAVSVRVTARFDGSSSSASLTVEPAG